MKIFYITFCINILSFIGYSQNRIATFSTTIWFEDAIGNIDSVIIGHDSMATLDIDPEYGEVELTEPFNSLFEVRAGTLINWPMPTGGWSREKLSKKIITSAEQVIGGAADGCWGGPDILIYIWAKNQPVKVFWDKSEFENQCAQGSLLTEHYTDQLATPYDWSRDTFFKCLSVENNLTVNSANWHHVNIEKEVESLGLQTIFGLRYFQQPYPGWTPCNEIVDVEKVEIDRNLVLYPNPTYNVLNINSENIKSAIIYDFQGKQVSHIGQSSKINVEYLSNGIYFLEIFDNNGIRQIKKFIKL